MIGFTTNAILWPVDFHWMRSFVPRKITIEFEQETDGRWIAEIPKLSGVMAYGPTRSGAAQAVKALALRVLADQLEEKKSDCNEVNIMISCA